MKMTPAIKGQITKAIDQARVNYTNNAAEATLVNVTRVFSRHMPREQAKHAAKRILQRSR